MNKSRLLPGITGFVVLTALCLPAVQADNIDSKIARQEGKIGKLNSAKRLSPGQTTQADNATYRISEEEQKMKTRHHGKLTANDRAKLNRQLRNNAARINNATHPPKRHQ